MAVRQPHRSTWGRPFLAGHHGLGWAGPFGPGCPWGALPECWFLSGDGGGSPSSVSFEGGSSGCCSRGTPQPQAAFGHRELLALQGALRESRPPTCSGASPFRLLGATRCSSLPFPEADVPTLRGANQRRLGGPRVLLARRRSPQRRRRRGAGTLAPKWLRLAAAKIKKEAKRRALFRDRGRSLKAEDIRGAASPSPELKGHLRVLHLLSAGGKQTLLHVRGHVRTAGGYKQQPCPPSPSPPSL